MRGVCILCEKYKYFCIFVTPVIHKYSSMANIQNFTRDFAFSAASIKNFTFDFVFQHQACLTHLAVSHHLVIHRPGPSWSPAGHCQRHTSTATSCPLHCTSNILWSMRAHLWVNTIILIVLTTTGVAFILLHKFSDIILSIHLQDLFLPFTNITCEC